MTSSHDGGRLMEKSTSCEVRYTAPSTMMSRRTATGVLVVVILGPSSREREGNGHRAHAVGTLQRQFHERPDWHHEAEPPAALHICCGPTPGLVARFGLPLDSSSIPHHGCPGRRDETEGHVHLGRAGGGRWACW